MKTVYWHRDLPPLEAEPLGEHTIEATSGKVQGSFAHHDAAWQSCYDDLMARTRDRLGQEVRRLGGDLAHVLDESIEPRADDATGRSWLHGRFTYVLYRLPTDEPSVP